MRRILHSLPLALLALTLPMLAQQSTPSKHTAHAYRSGEGAPKAPRTATALTFEQRTQNSADGSKRIRPYQVPKPGEGAPKA